MKGSYVLRLWLSERRHLTVGKLGTFEFPPGEYLYFGSALNGLEGRIRRHLRKDKRRFWHIDSLTAVAPVIGVWWTTGVERRECSLARAALDMEGAQMPARGFGASDCRCQSHLVYRVGDPATTGEESAKQPTSTPSALSIGDDLLRWKRPPKDLAKDMSLWK